MTVKLVHGGLRVKLVHDGMKLSLPHGEMNTYPHVKEDHSSW